MSYETVTNICNKYNIKFNYDKFDPRYKAIYQDYDWCYQKFVEEGLNQNQMAKEANCSKRVVEKWLVEKHRLTNDFRRFKKQLSEKQKDLIIGSLLGDGHIDKRESLPIFIVSHANNQKEYLYYKYDILKDLCNKEPSVIKERIEYFNSTQKSYQCQSQYRVCTRTYNCLEQYRNYSNIELINLLNEYSLAIWMLDDGHRSNLWSLCVARFSNEEIIHTIDTLNSKLGIEAYQKNCDKRYI